MKPFKISLRRAGMRLVCHHHDWWVESRWERWCEVKIQGGSFEFACRSTLPDGPHVRHLCVHPDDAAGAAAACGESRKMGAKSASCPQPHHKSAAAAGDGWPLGGNRRAVQCGGPLASSVERTSSKAALLAKLISPSSELMLTGRASSVAERGATCVLSPRDYSICR